MFLSDIQPRPLREGTLIQGGNPRHYLVVRWSQTIAKIDHVRGIVFHRAVHPEQKTNVTLPVHHLKPRLPINRLQMRCGFQHLQRRITGIAHALVVRSIGKEQLSECPKMMLRHLHPTIRSRRTTTIAENTHRSGQHSIQWCRPQIGRIEQPGPTTEVLLDLLRVAFEVHTVRIKSPAFHLFRITHPLERQKIRLYPLYNHLVQPALPHLCRHEITEEFDRIADCRDHPRRALNRHRRLPLHEVVPSIKLHPFGHSREGDIGRFPAPRSRIVDRHLFNQIGQRWDPQRLIL